MSTPDWTSTELRHEFHVYMVDALDHESVYGEIEAYSDRGTITHALGDGATVGASLEFPDWSQWRKNSWLRIIHEIPACQYKQTLGTFIVWDEGLGHGLNTDIAFPELTSCLRGLEYDLTYSLLTIGSQASLKEVVARLLRDTPMTYEFSPGMQDYRFTAPYVFDIGVSRLQILRSLCLLSGNEVWASEMGSILMKPRELISEKMSQFFIDEESDKTCVIEGSVKPISTEREVAGRSIAVWKGEGDTGQDSISAFADVSPKHLASPQSRGYVISAIHELEDLPGSKTYAGVQSEAKRWLSEDSASSYGWELQTMWLPVKLGDVVDFRPRGGRYRKCQITAMTQNLSSWLLDLTLKEV